MNCFLWFPCGKCSGKVPHLKWSHSTLRILLSLTQKTGVCAALHNSNRYSMPFEPFSVWSEQGDITPCDNKSTRGQEVRLTPCDLWPYKISLSHMPVAHHALPLSVTREKLSSQEQQHKPAPLGSKAPSELLSFTSWVQPAIETPPWAGSAKCDCC